MTLRGVAALAIILALAACASGPTPSPGPTVGPSSQPSPGSSWPAFEPGSVSEAVVQALAMSCESIAARVRCQAVRPSGARFEAVVPDGTTASDRELTFTASGPIELESEARRLFATVADAVSGDTSLSREWQDQIWAAFDEPQASSAALPNGISWSATRQDVGGVLVWTLSLTW